jgi:hypothetical protein
MGFKPAFRLQISGFSDANRVLTPPWPEACDAVSPSLPTKGALTQSEKAPSLQRHARRRELASGGLQLRAPLAELALGTLHAVEDEFVFRVEVRLPAILTRRQPDRVAVDSLRDDRDLRGAHRSDCTTSLRPYPRERCRRVWAGSFRIGPGLQEYDPA